MGGPGALGAYFDPNAQYPTGRVELAGGAPEIDSVLPHEMVHAWDFNNPDINPETHAAARLADVNQAVADMGSYGAMTQWIGDRAQDTADWKGLGTPVHALLQSITPNGNYGKGDPAHTTQYLYQSLGIPYADIPGWYRQKYMGFLSGQ